MKKTIWKSFAAMLLVAFIIFSAVSLNIEARAEEGDIASGIAGENISWVISADGTLTISGYGEFEIEWYSPAWIEYNDQITSVRIEEGITEIPDSLLVYLDYAKKIYIPSTVDWIGTFAFDNSYGIEEFIVAEENPYFKSVDGIIFTEDGTTLVRFPSNSPITEYVVPDEVTVIISNAFACTRRLRYASIGANVVNVGQDSFYNSLIEELDFNSSANTLAPNLITYARLTSFVIPDNIEYIGSSVLFGIDSLERLVIGSGVKSIANYFLAYTPNLSVVHYHGTEESWNTVYIGEENSDFLEKDVHFVAYKDGYEESCLDGRTGGLYCEICEEYFTGEIVPAIKDHVPGEAFIEENVPADCVNDGYYTSVTTCSDCGETLSVSFGITEAAFGHSWESEVCLRCGAECEHIDENYDTTCDECGRLNAFEYATVTLDVVGTVVFGDDDTTDEILIFRPTESGSYVIFSDNSASGGDEFVDPHVELRYANGNLAISHDDVGESYNFRLEFKAVAGETYVLLLGDWKSSAIPYEYVLTKDYAIEQEPTSVNPEFKITWDAIGSYQWYEYAPVYEITDEYASSVDLYGEGSAYVEGIGWTGDFGDDTGASFFKMELKEGDVILLDFGRLIDDDTGIFGIENSLGVAVYEGTKNGKIVLTVPADDIYEIYSYSVSEDTRLRAYILEKTVLDSETSLRLAAPKVGGVYRCEAEVNGTTLITSLFIYDYAISHKPTVDEPYVEVNAGDASYQWHEIVFSGEFTDDNATTVDWGRDETSIYTEAEGWQGIVDMYGDEDCFDFVTLSLTAGQTVIVLVDGDSVNSVGIYDYDFSYGENKECDEYVRVFHFEIYADGDYTVYAYGADSDTRVRVYLDMESLSIDGAEDNVFYAENDGYYLCDITYENGSKETVSVYLTAHAHIDEDCDYVCDECEAELPGKPSEDNTDVSNPSTDGTDTENPGVSTPAEDDNDADNSSDAGAPFNSKAVIIVAVILLAVIIGAIVVVIMKRS